MIVNYILRDQYVYKTTKELFFLLQTQQVALHISIFDDKKIVLDNSGHFNHALRHIKSGPAFGGIGASGLFQKGNFLEVPFKNEFYSVDFAVTFFYYIIEDAFSRTTGNRYCPLVQKGADDIYTREFNRSPGIYFDRKSKRIKIFLKTTDNKIAHGESFVSHSKITSQKWFHVAITKTKLEVSLYINGIFDNKIILKESVLQNKHPLYVGGVPWLNDQCNYPFLIDEFRYYNSHISEDYIQAEASPILGSIEPSFIKLGCLNCGLKKSKYFLWR